MADADERLLERFRDEIDRVVGPSIAVEGVERLPAPTGVGLAARCITPVGAWVIRADGETILEAFSRLCRRAAEDRVAIGFREVVGRG